MAISVAKQGGSGEYASQKTRDNLLSGVKVNIVLNQKDADFILKYLRKDLERIVESDKDLDSKFEMLQKSYDKDELKKDPVASSLMKIATVMTKAVNESSNTVKKDLEHCIELLVCGSDNVN